MTSPYFRHSGFNCHLFFNITENGNNKSELTETQACAG